MHRRGIGGGTVRTGRPGTVSRGVGTADSLGPSSRYAAREAEPPVPHMRAGLHASPEGCSVLSAALSAESRPWPANGRPQSHRTGPLKPPLRPRSGAGGAALRPPAGQAPRVHARADRGRSGGERQAARHPHRPGLALRHQGASFAVSEACAWGLLHHRPGG